MSYVLQPIGTIESTLKDLNEAPRQGREGAPDATIRVDEKYARGIRDLKAGDEILVLTWLDRARRDVLEVHPRDDERTPLTGVFSTRSSHRPNPIGVHPVTVRKIDGLSLTVGPIEAVDGTPVVDIKPAL